MKRILVADDSQVARFFVRRCLEIAGCNECEFVEAADGQQALSIVRSQPIDLIVTDLNMPVLNGEQLLASIVASPKLHGVPVVIVSSMGSAVHNRELLRHGALAVIPKPVSPAALEQALRPLLGDTRSSWGTGLSGRLEGRGLTALQEAVAEVFSDMAFLEALPDGKPADTSDDLLIACVPILRPQAARLFLCLPAALLQETTGAAYGSQTDPPSESMMRDALAEMACTLVGGFLRRLLPPGEPFALGTADIVARRGPFAVVGDTNLAFSTGTQRFWVALQAQQRPAASQSPS